MNHQAAVARERDRSVENRYSGQAIDDPAPNLPGLARDFGWTASLEVTDLQLLLPTIMEGIGIVRQGGSHFISVRNVE